MAESNQVLEDKMDPVVADHSTEEVYDPSKEVSKYGTKYDQTDMYRLGKEQKFRVGRSF